jgi:hypothetical protein|tara:strand:+ start:1103 stop:1411 length:309 start_codon:yes stop_codon:yes gene_type:complete
MCFFGGGGVGPQSSADLANTGNKPVKQQVVNKAVQNQQTADKNTMRRADSYGSQQAASSASASTTTAKKSNNAQAVQGGMATMNALNDYNKSRTNKKTILGS